MKAVKATFKGSDKAPIIKGLVFGVVTAIAVILILTSITAIVLYKTGSLPYDVLDYVMIAISCVGVFFGALVTSKIIKQRGLMFGIVCAVIILIITFASGMGVFNSSPTVISLIRIIALIICGAIAGVIGVNQKDKIRIK